MAKRVFLETTIPSFLASWRTRDLLQAARQQITLTWWEGHRHAYELCTSQIVLDEVADGDPDAAQKRLAVLKDIPLLELTDEVGDLARAIMESGLLPPKAVRDAIHITVAAVHGVDILLTWNCRHIANATIMKELESVVRSQGFELPILCTPEQILGE